MTQLTHSAPANQEKKAGNIKKTHTRVHLRCCFAVYTSCYMQGFATELAGNLYSILSLMCSFLLSRCISGFAVVTFRSAKKQWIAAHIHRRCTKTHCSLYNDWLFYCCSNTLFLIDWFVAFLLWQVHCCHFVCTHYVLSPVWRHYGRYCRLFGAAM